MNSGHQVLFFSPPHGAGNQAKSTYAHTFRIHLLDLYEYLFKCVLTSKLACRINVYITVSARVTCLTCAAVAVEQILYNDKRNSQSYMTCIHVREQNDEDLQHRFHAHMGLTYTRWCHSCS